MGLEVERKLTVKDDRWRAFVVSSSTLRQGYLSLEKERVVRVRLVDGKRGYLTIKGIRRGDARAEFEYPIPGEDAAELLDTVCVHPLVEKTRHHLELPGGDWTVDEFAGDNEGLTLVEVEYDPAKGTPPALPEWAAEDVTEDDRYANNALVEAPYRLWR